MTIGKVPLAAGMWYAGARSWELMFERFTDSSRRVLVLSQEEARLLGHNFIGTEHLLLGLLREGDGVAAQCLRAMGVHIAEAREQVEQTVGTPTEPVQGSPPFTVRAKRVLELSLQEALVFHHSYIGTEHLLLAIARDGDGVAANVLVNLGLRLPEVRRQVFEMMAERGDVSAPASPASPAGAATVLGLAEQPSTEGEDAGQPLGEPADADDLGGVVAGAGVRCNRCGSDLAKWARHRILEVPADDCSATQSPVWLTVVYCSRCGRLVSGELGRGAGRPSFSAAGSPRSG